MPSNLDQPQIIQSVYLPDEEALKVSPSGLLVNEPYDYVEVAYPDDVTEIYTYRIGGAGGVVQATVTIVYTDNTKAAVQTVTKTPFSNFNPGSGGDVVGPASAVDNEIVLFDGISGKLIKSSGVTVDQLGDVFGPNSSTSGQLALYDGTTGKLLGLSGVVDNGNLIPLSDTSYNLGVNQVDNQFRFNQLFLASGLQIGEPDGDNSFSIFYDGAGNLYANTIRFKTGAGVPIVSFDSTGIVLKSDGTQSIVIADDVGAANGKKLQNITLVAGSATVSNTSVTAKTVFLVTNNSLAGAVTPPSYSVAKNVGVGYTITSSDVADTSVVTVLLLQNGV